jgi:hypothetical protein
MGKVTAPENIWWFIPIWLWFGAVVWIRLGGSSPGILIVTLLFVFFVSGITFFQSSHRPRSLVGFCLRYSSDIGRSSYSVLPIVSPFIVSLPLNRTSGPNQSLQLTAGRRDD